MHKLAKDWSEKSNKDTILTLWSGYALAFVLEIFRPRHLPILLGIEVVLWRRETEMARRRKELQACYARLNKEWIILNAGKRLLQWMGFIDPKQMSCLHV